MGGGREERGRGRGGEGGGVETKEEEGGKGRGGGERMEQEVGGRGERVGEGGGRGRKAVEKQPGKPYYKGQCSLQEKHIL